MDCLFTFETERVKYRKISEADVFAEILAMKKVTLRTKYKDVMLFRINKLPDSVAITATWSCKSRSCNFKKLITELTRLPISAPAKPVTDNEPSTPIRATPIKSTKAINIFMLTTKDNNNLSRRLSNVIALERIRILSRRRILDPIEFKKFFI
jgi:hypothetical protein